MAADFEELLRQAADDNDRKAYEQTIGRIHTPIWDYAYRRAGSDNFADEVLSEVLVILFTAIRRGKITSPSHLEGFAFVTASNVCLRLFKAQGRIGGHDQLDAAVDYRPGGDEEAVRNDRTRLIRLAIAELDVEDQEALAAVADGGVSNTELGLRLGVSARGAGTRKHRALNQLHQVLRRLAPSLAAEYPRGGGRPAAKPRA